MIFFGAIGAVAAVVAQEVLDLSRDEEFQRKIQELLGPEMINGLRAATARPFPEPRMIGILMWLCSSKIKYFNK